MALSRMTCTQAVYIHHCTITTPSKEGVGVGAQGKGGGGGGGDGDSTDNFAVLWLGQALTLPLCGSSSAKLQALA